ncbi:helix-turn-helix domain-containing protein, partial [Brochothrix thermosphacta]|uniref:helix-turn-helix domain-containing protein n=1 Tax=Brochothrix thermosphacta TaxID=2756 RepID=UPI0011478C5D
IVKNILENHLARKLILIELLYNKKKYIQIEDAIEILDCSKNTLLKDILEINNYFYIIEFEKNKGFFFNKERGINFNFIYCKLLTESMSVQLLFNILTSEATITDISHDMFVSESKVRKIVSRWNCYINSRNFSFEISVEKNKLILEGNETEIRLFCHYM